MGSNGQGVYVCHLKRNATKRLNRVSVEKRTHLMSCMRKVYNWLNNARLIIGIHDGNKGYRLIQKTLKGRSLNLSLTVRLSNSYLKALLAKNRRKIQNRIMLNCRENHRVALVVFVANAFCHSKDREVIALSAARAKDHVRSSKFAAYRTCNNTTSTIKLSRCLTTKRVQRVWVHPSNG